MPYKLTPFSGVRIWTGSVGVSVSMHIESASSLAKLTNVTWNNGALAVTDDSAFSLTLVAGTTILRLLVQSPDGIDRIQLYEDCGGGEKQKIDDFAFDSNDPARAWRIFGA